MRDNPLLAGGSLESKPAWGNNPRCCPTLAFLVFAGSSRIANRCNAVAPACGVSSTRSGRRLLSDANTKSSTTTIRAGRLQIGNAVTTGTLNIGHVTENAPLSFSTGRTR